MVDIKQKTVNALQTFEEPGFAILQPTEQSEKRFLNFEKINKNVVFNDYDISGVYKLKEKLYNKPIDEVYEIIFHVFNTCIPTNFKSYSLSVGDIIALKRNNKIQFGFVDSFGFTHLDKETVHLISF